MIPSFLLIALSCASTPPPVPTPVPTPVETAPPPMAPPTGRSIVTTERRATWWGTVYGAAVEEAVEQARQAASQCHASRPETDRAVEVSIQAEASGVVTRVATDEPEPVIGECLRTSLSAIRFPTSYGEFPGLSVSVAWRFTVIPTITPERDCIFDRECVLVTGGCGGPAAVADRAASDVDAANQKRLSVASCDGGYDPPVSARCREGYCTAVPADLVDLRACTSDGGCVAIEKGCGWDAVAAKRADEARSILAPGNDDAVCDSRPSPPVPRCRYNWCTVQWAGD